MSAGKEAMQNDHSETSSERGKHMRPSSDLSSHEEAQKPGGLSDGGYLRDERQGIRDLSEIRRERQLSVGRYRNKPRGWREQLPKVLPMSAAGVTGNGGVRVRMIAKDTFIASQVIYDIH